MSLDLGNLPFEKAFYFIARTLPGFVLIEIYNVVHPGTVLHLFSITYLGYDTKLILLGAVSFLLGYTVASFITSFLSAGAGAVGALWGGMMTARHPYQDMIAPWRSKAWRAAYRKRYGASAPEDLFLVPESAARSRLQEAYDSIVNDKEWKRCHINLHSNLILAQKMELIEEIAQGLDSNLTLSAVIILSAAVFWSPFRVWWLLLPSFAWFIVSAISISAKIYRLADPWTTHSEQIDSLQGN